MTGPESGNSFGEAPAALVVALVVSLWSSPPQETANDAITMSEIGINIFFKSVDTSLLTSIPGIRSPQCPGTRRVGCSRWTRLETPSYGVSLNWPGIALPLRELAERRAVEDACDRLAHVCPKATEHAADLGGATVCRAGHMR